MPIYLSQSHDPFINLAIENGLFRHVLKEQPILLLWQNHPCVVIGRAQNPWIECDLTRMKADDIPLVRRQSGGGTVYHDLGNLNISLMFPNATYSVAHNLQLVCLALKTLGVTIKPNDRNDLILMHQGQAYKVSGSAFRQTKHHAFHHLTLLLEADLTHLGQYLKPNLTGITAKGVASVRSQVINLKAVLPHLSMEMMKTSLVQAFQTQYGATKPEQVHTLPSVDSDQDELLSWEWRFGKTLPFEHRLEVENAEAIIHIERGLVTKIESENLPNSIITSAQANWIQQRYDPEKLRSFFQQYSGV